MLLLNAPVDRQLFMIFYGSLIVWGLSSFLTYEFGPFGVFQKIREVIGVRRDILKDTCTGKNVFAQMLCCFKCTAFWMSIVVALLMVGTQPLAFLGLVLVLRTLAIIYDRVING